MDKRQVEIERLMLDYEKQCIKDLQKTYTEALADVKLKLRSLLGRDPTLSVAYQIEFQRTLEAQLQNAIDTLKSGSITSVTDFLNKTYEDGYLGTIYSIQGQGIPINIGVDHKQAARVINRKTDTFKFSDRLYKNVDELAVAFKSEMTRGIANNSGYSMIARQLSLVSEANYKRALTIVRTEGGRVKSEAKLDSMKDAKKEGADIVKQWDSTFDGKTRPEHRFLDGQIREIDEPFTDSQGRQAQAPHKFGVASMDINCRCIVVERARWAVEGEEMPNKVDNETGDLVEADNYKEWKEKAQKQLNEKKENEFNKRKDELEKNGVKVFDKDTKNVPKKGDYFQTANKELVEIVEISDYNGIKTATLANGETVVLKNAKDATPVKAVETKPITEELQTAFTEYADGRYGFYCTYSQGIMDGDTLKKDYALKYNVGIYEKEKGVSKCIELTQDMVDTIQTQPFVKQDLCRIERNAYSEKMTYTVGEEVTWGIRSTSRDSDFADKVLKGLDDGIKWDGEKDGRRFTVFNIRGETQSLDISKYSKYDQSESLVCGRFKVVSKKQVDLAADWKAQQSTREKQYLSYKADVKKSLDDLGIKYETFVSKNGNEMYRVGNRVITKNAFESGNDRYLDDLFAKKANYNEYASVPEGLDFVIDYIDLEQKR